MTRRCVNGTGRSVDGELARVSHRTLPADARVSTVMGQRRGAPHSGQVTRPGSGMTTSLTASTTTTFISEWPGPATGDGGRSAGRSAGAGAVAADPVDDLAGGPGPRDGLGSFVPQFDPAR